MSQATSPALASKPKALPIAAILMVVGSLILVEALFDWRGTGWMLFNTLTNSRSITFFNPLILALLLAMTGAILILVDLLASMLSLWINPLGRQASVGRG